MRTTAVKATSTKQDNYSKSKYFYNIHKYNLMYHEKYIQYPQLKAQMLYMCN